MKLNFSKQNNIHGTNANASISGLNVILKAIASGKKFKHAKVKNIVSFLKVKILTISNIQLIQIHKYRN